MCNHHHQHCEGKVCVCVDCGERIPSMDIGEFEDVYRSRFCWEQAVKERTANRKLLTFEGKSLYNRISRRAIEGARQIA